MKILRFENCKNVILDRTLLSVTVFLVIMSCADVSRSNADTDFNNTSFLPPESTTPTKRPWPSYEFLRSVIDGGLQNMTDNYTSQILNSNQENIVTRATRTKLNHSFASSAELEIEPLISEDIIQNTARRSLNTPSISFGFPLQISTSQGRGDSEYHTNPERSDSGKYIKISGRHNLRNSGNHWQILNKTNVIVAQRNRDSPGFGWLYEDLPPGFSPLAWPYHKFSTPLPSTSTLDKIFGIAITGRPPLVFSAIPEYRPSSTAQIEPEFYTRRPSVVIVKDKVSSLHWGSSGSTLPPQYPDSQYSLTTPENLNPSPVNTQVHPYQQYSGGDTISGNNLVTKAPTSIWYKPTLTQYTTTVAPFLLTPKPNNPIVESENKNIMFKIWSYLNDGRLKLEGEREIPAFILNGHLVKDGAILNYDDIPAPSRHIVSSSLKNFGSAQWQQLPILEPGLSSGLVLNQQPVRRKEKPVSLNYVIWGSSTTPSPLTTLPAPEDYHKHLQDYFNQLTTPTPPKLDPNVDTRLLLQNYIQNQLTTRTPFIQGLDPLRVGGGDANSLANTALLQFISAQLSKQSDTPQSPRPKAPISTSSINRLTPPNRNSFLAYLYPIYQHLLTKQVRFPNIIRDEQLNPLSGLQDGFAADFAADPLSALQQFGSNDPILTQSGSEDFPLSITENYQNSAEIFRKDLIQKSGKSSRRKARKKRKCKKNCKGYKHEVLDIIHPQNFQANYDFKVDFLDILRKKFYALLALKLAPIIIISLAAATPFAFLLWPQVFKMIKNALHGHKTKSHPPFHNHYQNQFNNLHTSPGHPQSYPHSFQKNADFTEFGQEQEYPEPHYPAQVEFESQKHQFQQYQQAMQLQDQLMYGDNSENFGMKNQQRVGTSGNGQIFTEYPGSHIAALVDQGFGNKNPTTQNGMDKTLVSSNWKAIPGPAGPQSPHTKYSPSVSHLPMPISRSKRKNTIPRIRNPDGHLNFDRAIPSRSSQGNGIVRDGDHPTRPREFQIPSSLKQ